MEGFSAMSNKHTLTLSNTKIKMLDTIQKVYAQQYKKAYGEKGATIENRIVSLSKPYLRPIVRGKEVKPVEFGAKVSQHHVEPELLPGRRDRALRAHECRVQRQGAREQEYGCHAPACRGGGSQHSLSVDSESAAPAIWARRVGGRGCTPSEY